jgi:predicted ester cyclase
MSVEDNKAIVGRWFSEFWGKQFNAAVIDELAAPDIRLEYSLHAPLRGRDAVREFAAKFRAAFPDLGFEGTADLIAEGDYVVGQWIGGGTQTGGAFDDMPMGGLPGPRRSRPRWPRIRTCLPTPTSRGGWSPSRTARPST